MAESDLAPVGAAELRKSSMQTNPQVSWFTKTMTLVIVGIVSIAALPHAVDAQTVKVDGSSTVFPVIEAVAEEFQIQKRGKVRVTVGISGTGGGFKKFCRGETDISNGSRPILKAEMEACAASGVKYVELPIAFDALTIVVNPQNTWAKTMTVADLKRIWEPAAQGKITKWKQVRPEWPDQPIVLFGAGADSGTFDYFTEAIVGKAKSSRGDFTASEDDNVLVQGVESNKNALGYFGFAYYAPHKAKLTAVNVDGGKGPVGPSIEAVINGSYQPLSRPLFIYVKEASIAKVEVREFVEFALVQGAELVQEVGYVPLPKDAYDKTMARFKAKKLGTVFGGVPEVGVKINDLVAREGKL
jgi:phosphate transport system substrate-binding protein